MDSKKVVIEEVSGILRHFSDNTVDRAISSVPEATLLSKQIPPHEEFIDGVAVKDRIINKATGLAVRIYVPETNIINNNKLPVILHFHGGGFCFSQPNEHTYYHFYKQLVRSTRAVCVSVYLRLAPEHRLPAACDDAYSAYQWLGAIARGELTETSLENYADFNRIVLIGDSSGGNLVHQVILRAGKSEDCEAEPIKIVGGILLHPGFIGAKLSKSFLDLPDSPMLTREMVIKLLNLALPVGSNLDHPITCPMGPAAPPLNEIKLPPFLLVVAEMDLLRDTQMEYSKAIEKAGNDIKVFFQNGMGHCYYLNKIAIDADPISKVQVDQLICEIKNFIDRH